MLSICKANSDNFGNLWFDQITSRLSRSTKYSLNKLNEYIQIEFGSSYSLAQLILAHPDELDELAGQWESNPGDVRLQDGELRPELQFFITYYGYLTDHATPKYTDGDNPFSNRTIFDFWGLQTCPYCNRNFIEAARWPDGQRKETGELDHFYSQSVYPIFALSIYNLVPACKVCNKLKDNNPKKIHNPHNPTGQKHQTPFWFAVRPKNGRFPQTKSSFDLTFRFNESLDRTLTHNQLKIFELERLYAQHNDVAHEIIQRHFVFNESYLKELYHKYQNLIFRSPADIHKAIFARYEGEENLHRRPFSKLAKDIEDHLATGVWKSKIE